VSEREPRVFAAVGLLVAILLVGTMALVAVQVVEDAPRRTSSTTAPPAPAIYTPPATTATAPGPPAEPYPGAWCKDHCSLKPRERGTAPTSASSSPGR
jgi:hypothetical protein